MQNIRPTSSMSSSSTSTSSKVMLSSPSSPPSTSLILAEIRICFKMQLNWESTVFKCKAYVLSYFRLDLSECQPIEHSITLHESNLNSRNRGFKSLMLPCQKNAEKNIQSILLLEFINAKLNLEKADPALRTLWKLQW